jgi:hypothetical protein
LFGNVGHQLKPILTVRFREPHTIVSVCRAAADGPGSQKASLAGVGAIGYRSSLFGRERGDDFLETRIAAQWAPDRV